MPAASRTPARTLRFDAATMALTLFRGTEGTAFRVVELPCDESGRRVFRLSKCDESETYTVSVVAGGRPECDCRAGVYRESCRHGDAMHALIAARLI